MSTVKLGEVHDIIIAKEKACYCGSGGWDDRCGACQMFDTIKAMEFVDKKEAQDIRRSADRWRELYTNYCHEYHSAAKERDVLKQEVVHLREFVRDICKAERNSPSVWDLNRKVCEAITAFNDKEKKAQT